MAPICTIFVQNTWKKDLCSNCFKTKDEHGVGSPNGSSHYTNCRGDGSGRKHPITSSILNSSDYSKKGERTLSDSGTPTSRYVGVANTRIGYQRYSYNSRLGNASEASGLKSPGLIFKSDSNSTLNVSQTDSTGLRSPGLLKGLSSTDLSNEYTNKYNCSPLRNSGTISSSTSSLSSTASNQVNSHINYPHLEKNRLSRREYDVFCNLTDVHSYKPSHQHELENNFTKNIQEKNTNDRIREMHLVNALSKNIQQNGYNNVDESSKPINGCHIPQYYYPRENSFDGKTRMTNTTTSGDSTSDASNGSSEENYSPTDSGVLSVNVSPDIDNHQVVAPITSRDSSSVSSDSISESTDSDDHCDGFYAFGQDSNDTMLRTSDIESENIEFMQKNYSHLGEIDQVSLKEYEVEKAYQKVSRSIDFNLQEIVIGYGGDDIYSDSDDFYNPDISDNDSLESFELTDREKILKRLTLQNTDFNAENENLDEEATLHANHHKLLQDFEKANEDYDIYEDIKTVYKPVNKSKYFKDFSFNGEPTSKLKGSSAVYVKKVNPVLPMKNGELVTDSTTSCPLLDLKPKYVHKDEEIRENVEDISSQSKSHSKLTSFGNDERKDPTKVTSFGSESDDKVTCFNEVPEKTVSLLSKTSTSTRESSEYSHQVLSNELPPVVRPARQKKKKNDNLKSKNFHRNKFEKNNNNITCLKREIENRLSNFSQMKQDCKVSSSTEIKAGRDDVMEESNTNTRTVKIDSSVKEKPKDGYVSTSNSSEKRNSFMASILNSSENTKFHKSSDLSINLADENEPIFYDSIRKKIEIQTQTIPNMDNAQNESEKLKLTKPICAPKPLSLTYNKIFSNSNNGVARNLSAKFSVMGKENEVMQSTSIPNNDKFIIHNEKFNRDIEVKDIEDNSIINENLTVDKPLVSTEVESIFKEQDTEKMHQSAVEEDKTRDPIKLGPNENASLEVDLHSNKVNEDLPKFNNILNPSNFNQFQLPPFQEVTANYTTQPTCSVDVDSYSSFTDDFDDDDDDFEEELQQIEEIGTNALQNVQSPQEVHIPSNPELDSNTFNHRAERSSSATPFSRGASTSSGPTNYDATAFLQYLIATSGTSYSQNGDGKKIKTRSQSCPRDGDTLVKGNHKPIHTSKSSKFGFKKPSFFRPNSPVSKPTSYDLTRTEGNTNRGRDRSKKLAKFSLKKFWKMGTGVVMGTSSKDDEKKSFREAVKNAEREAKKSKLNIIHPLDYNQTGVEVISRPEKVTPTLSTVQTSENNKSNSQKHKGSHNAHELKTNSEVSSNVPKPLTSGKPSNVVHILTVTNSKETSFKEATTTTVKSTSHNQNVDDVKLSSNNRRPQNVLTSKTAVPNFNTIQPEGTLGTVQPITLATSVGSTPVNSAGPSTAVTLRKNNSFHSHQERRVERRASNISSSAIVVRRDNRVSCPPNTLGYNSEGKPKPPPPPRKTSLDSNNSRQQEIVYQVPKIQNVSSESQTTPNASSPAKQVGSITVSELLKQRQLLNPTPSDSQSSRRESPSPSTANTSDSPLTVLSTSPNDGGAHSTYENAPAKRPYTAPQNNAQSINQNNNNFSPGLSPLRPKAPPMLPNRSGNNGSIGAPRLPPKDMVYANIGDVRAPFTPRKPNRLTNSKQEEQGATQLRPYSKLPHPPLPKPSQAPPVSIKPAVVSQNSRKRDSPHHDYETISCSLEQWLQEAASQGWGQDEKDPEEVLEGVKPLLQDEEGTLSIKKLQLTSSESSLNSNISVPYSAELYKAIFCHRTHTCLGEKSVAKTVTENNDYEVIECKNKDSTLENTNKNHLKSITPKPKFNKEMKRITKRRKSRGTPVRRYQNKYGAVKKQQIKHVSNSYYRTLPFQRNSTDISNVNMRHKEKTHLYEAVSSGYSSRCSSISSKNSSSSLGSISSTVTSNSEGSSTQNADKSSRSRRTPCLGFSCDEETWIPETKELKSSDQHQLQNKQNLDKVNEVAISKYLTGLHSLYSKVQNGSTPSDNSLERVADNSTSSLEVLTRVVNTLSHLPPIPSADYSKVASYTKSWQDIALLSEAPSVKSGHRVYQVANVLDTPVTVLITPETTLEPHPLLGPQPLAVLRESRVKGTVWVLPRMTLYTLVQYRDVLSSRALSHAHRNRVVASIMLQLLTALKQLQAQGVEEASQDLLLLSETEQLASSSSTILPKLVVNTPPPGCPFPLPASSNTLCQVAVIAADLLGVSTGSSESAVIFSAVTAVLRQERAASLTKAQGLLEVFLFGPTTDLPSPTEESYQIWLETKRHSLVQSLTEGESSQCDDTGFSDDGGFYDLGELCHGVPKNIPMMMKYQLMFLARTNPRSLVQFTNLIKE